MIEAERVVRAYYEAFNAGDKAAFLALLTEDVIHDINQGQREIGRKPFDAFFERMARMYGETITDLAIMVDATGSRAAAEFLVQGTYKQAEPGLPAARGQAYRLPAGAFFEVRDGQVARITNYYNLPDWVRQVS